MTLDFYGNVADCFRSWTAQEVYKPYTPSANLRKIMDGSNETLNVRVIREDIIMLDKVKKIIINPPCTIIIWKDNTKTMVRCRPEDTFDAEKGIAMCFMRKMFNSSTAMSKYIKEVFEANVNNLVQNSKKSDNVANVVTARFVDGHVGVIKE